MVLNVCSNRPNGGTNEGPLGATAGRCGPSIDVSTSFLSYRVSLSTPPRLQIPPFSFKITN